MVKVSFSLTEMPAFSSSLSLMPLTVTAIKFFLDTFFFQEKGMKTTVKEQSP
mgnify:CR=1 FL=1